MASNYNLNEILKNFPVAKEKRRINPRDLALAEKYLGEAGLLNEEAKNLLQEHHDLGFLADALGYLSRNKILTPQNFKDVAAHDYPRNLSLILRYLHDKQLLTPDNRTRVIAHLNANKLSDAIGYVHRVGLLTQENLNDIFESHDPVNLVVIYRYLNEHQLLTPTNRVRMMHFGDLNQLEHALEALHLTQMLNEDVLSQVLAPEHAVLISEEARELVWDQLPGHLLRANWQRIILSQREPQPLNALRRVIAQILGHQDVDYNPQQSTHTASVHRSVSESAAKLMKHYGPINLERTLARMQQMVVALDDKTLVHKAAKRAFVRITEPSYTFTDRTSDISTRQLLALAFLAIHDDALRSASFDDAKFQLVQGLYEIQRGYNIDAAGIDDNKPQDLPICVAGTFNKILEKLYGIHPLVELVYTTKEGAYTKFPKLVQQYALDYLKSIASPRTAAEYQAALVTLKRVMLEDSVESIWPKIQGRVKDAIWDEFHEAFGNNADDTGFKTMLDYYTECDIPDVSPIETQLKASAGYRDLQLKNSVGDLTPTPPKTPRTPGLRGFLPSLTPSASPRLPSFWQRRNQALRPNQSSEAKSMF